VTHPALRQVPVPPPEQGPWATVAIALAAPAEVPEAVDSAEGKTAADELTTEAPT
jgi:hypothetical protein